MPITATANNKKFTFPDGTNPEQMGIAIDEFFSSQQPEVKTVEAVEPAAVPTPSAEEEFKRRTEVGFDPLRTLMTGAFAEPFAGIAGIIQAINPFADEGAGERAVEATREALTVLPGTEAGTEALARVGETLQPLAEGFGAVERTLGDEVLELTGSETLAAIAHTLPTAVLELLGLGAGRRAIAIAKKGKEKSQAAVQAVNDARAGKVTDQGAEKIVETIQKGTPKEVSDIINADPEFFRAADELGISTEPLAGFASQNPQFRDVEAALRKVPGSVLEPQAIKFIEETSQAADNLIQKYGGTIDKTQLGLDFKRSAVKTIENLVEQADNVYGTITELIPPGNRHKATATVEFLTDLSNKLGGEAELPGKLRRMLKSLSVKELPTLGKIDQLRREIGQAIGKGSGSFKDVESGLNKAIYARLTRDQDAIAATIPGGSNITEAAKNLIKQRKQLEDNLQLLLGKDLNKALNVNVSGAIKNLQKGEVDRFNEIMNAIPKHKRGEVALSAMNDVFKGTGVNQQGLSPTQFTKWFQTINRSPAVKKALFDVLPKESRRAIENLFQVSRGISRSLGQTTPTGRINALFNPSTGIIRRMIGRTAVSAAAIATGSPVAAAATSVTMDFLKQTTDGARRAADLMGSPQFQNIVRRSAKEGVIDGAQPSAKLLDAEAALTKSKQFESWANTLGRDDRAALQGGLISYLFRQEDQEQ